MLDGVECTVDDGVAELRATIDLGGIASPRFADSDHLVDLDLALTDQAELLGFAFTQFAMPVVAAPGDHFDFAPAHNLRSPACVLPLLVRDGERCLLLAPLTNPHEQIIIVSGRTVRWGWHGDLDEVAAGFSTRLQIFEGPSADALLEQWGEILRSAPAVERRPRSRNPLTSHLSYWTDNGAAYWYRTEPDEPIAQSVVAKVAELRDESIPVRSVELDSWFYRHETPRAIAEIGYPEEVPPTGMLEWQPRRDAFPALWSDDPMAEFRRRVDVPLVLHSRHIAPTSAYVDDAWWVDRAAAMPTDSSFFRRWFDDAVRWGAVCIEQDWMLLYWFGVREMRSTPGRAMAWQRAMNDHASATDIDLLWCMATPADLIAAVELDRVIAVRTSDDYRFTEDPALLWTWFLTVNRLVTPLGLWPFKDCFFSNPKPDAGDPISGDRHAEIEALLSAMSGGPVGIGDRIGHTDHDIVMRTCDDDGRLRQPDVPIGLIDDCLFGSPERGERLAWATASTTIDSDTWTYVIALNTATDPTTVDDVLDLSEIGIDEARHIHHWRIGETSMTTRVRAELPPRDWALFVVCPPGSTDVGDTTKYVTVPAVADGARHHL